MAQKTYAQVVESLADRMGLAYPVLEDDLLLCGVIFKFEDKPDIKLNDSQMELGERLFIQYYALRHGVRAGSLYVQDMTEHASRFFADGWEMQDPFVFGMSDALLVEIVWKADV